MNGELHPEESLDRALKGQLSEAECAELQKHLSTCLACKAHLSLMEAALDSATPQARDERVNRLAIEAAVEQFRRPRWFAPTGRHGIAPLVAAILLTFVGLAAAARHFQAPRSSGTRVPQALQAQVPELGIEARPVSSPAAVPTATGSEAIVPTIQSADTAHARQEVVLPPSASALFAQASALSAKGQTTLAVANFLRLQRLFPSSRESHLSFALTGRLLLQRGRAAEALVQFDRYLVQGGQAAEEALVERASALAKLGRSADERATWQRLLNTYPRSVYDRKARARIAQLNQPPPASAP